MPRSRTAKVWTIGNTTVRNPERLPVALLIFNKYFSHCHTFSGNTEQQRAFFEKLLTYTETGEPYDPQNPIAPPFYSFISESGEVSMLSKEYKEKNGRLWLSPLDDLGFISAYRGSEARICPPGQIVSMHPELLGEIWFRQVLKFQYPNPKSEISGGGSIRSAVLLFSLMLQLDGLSSVEMGLCHLVRGEKTDGLIALIKEYRKRRNAGENIQKLKREITRRSLFNHFSSDIDERIKLLSELLGKIRSGFVSNDKTIISFLNPIVALGKGHNTKRANMCKKILLRTMISSNPSLDKIKKIFLDYYFLVKSSTISKDYPDLTKRYLSMTGMLEIYRSENGESRLRVSSTYSKIVRNTLASLPPICPMETEEDEERYLQYLWNPNMPILKIDDPDILKKEIVNIKNRLCEMNWDVCLKERPKSSLITPDRLVYNILKNELKKAEEVQYANSLEYPYVKSKLKILSNDGQLRAVTPTEVETWIWNSILLIGGYTCHPSKTRNFNVDTNFESIFSAAGNQPDMQFLYPDFDLVVEVTKNRGKTQWRAEAEPVTRHVATHSFFSKRHTLGLFIAPSIHSETAEEFFKKSKGNKVIIDSFGTSQKISIVPITFRDYASLYENLFKGGSKKPYHMWFRFLNAVSKEIVKSKDPLDWLSNINRVSRSN